MSGDTDVKILVLLGSLRRESVNRQLVELAVEVAPAGVTAKAAITAVPASTMLAFLMRIRFSLT